MCIHVTEYLLAVLDRNMLYYVLSVLYVHYACPCCTSTLHVNTAFPCFGSMLHVYAAHHYHMSMLHAHASQPGLHAAVHAACAHLCLCSMIMLYEHVA
jgi:hypothetical protein